MINLIKAHLFRIFKDKITYVFLIIVAAQSILTPVVYFIIGKTMASDMLSLMSISTTLISSFGVSGAVVMLYTIVMAILILKECGYGTMRNQVVSGYSKGQIFFSYLIVSLAIGIVFIGVSQALTVTLSLAFGFSGGYEAYDISGVPFIGFYFILWLIFLTGVVVLNTVALTTRSIPITILICVAAPVFISLACFIAFIVVFTNSNGDLSVINTTKEILDFVPYYQNFTICNLSIMNGLLKSISGVNLIDTTFIVKAIVENVVLAGGFTALGYFVFRKEDMK